MKTKEIAEIETEPWKDEFMQLLKESRLEVKEIEGDKKIGYRSSFLTFASKQTKRRKKKK